MTRIARLVLLVLACALAVSTGASVLKLDERDRDRLSGGMVACHDPGPTARTPSLRTATS